MSQGGGGVNLSWLKMVSREVLVYLKSVSRLSCRSSDWRRYLHPLSAGVPGHDETRSVKSQSDVSDSLW